MTVKPLILFTNDDGIESPGLWAAVAAFADFADLLVVAPRLQQSGTGRSLPRSSEGRIDEQTRVINGVTYTGYAVDGTPAQAVQHAILELAPRLPDLVVSGINYGENLGNGITISGTVGAAIEAASLNIPSLAVSQQTPTDLHLSYAQIDFSTSAYFTRFFGEWVLAHALPADVHLLKIDVPMDATPHTTWRITRLSQRRIYHPTRPKRTSLQEIGKVGYEYRFDPQSAEPDSDAYVLFHERLVSVTPISMDMTSRIDFAHLSASFNSKDLEAGV